MIAIGKPFIFDDISGDWHSKSKGVAVKAIIFSNFRFYSQGLKFTIWSNNVNRLYANSIVDGEAGKMAVEYFNQGCKWQLKDNNTFVTEADRAVETFLVEKIIQHYPGHIIIAEEGSQVNGKEFAWVVDPIDGTTAFVWGVPTWCISIGVLRNWEPYFALIYLPITQENLYDE